MNPSEPDTRPSLADPERWVDEHGDYLYGFARFRVRLDAVAEDMVQETLLAAWKARDRFEGRSSERTWLTAILKNKIREYLRTSRREIPESDLVFDDSAPSDYFDKLGHINVEHAPKDWSGDPMEAAHRADFRKILQHCLDQLPPRTAELFIAREVEGDTTKELSERYGMTANNLFVLLHRARRALRDCRSSQGVRQHFLTRELVGPPWCHATGTASGV